MADDIKANPSQSQSFAVAKSVVLNLASHTSVLAMDFIAQSNKSSRFVSVPLSILRAETSSMTAFLYRVLMVMPVGLIPSNHLNRNTHLVFDYLRCA